MGKVCVCDRVRMERNLQIHMCMATCVTMISPMAVWSRKSLFSPGQVAQMVRVSSRYAEVAGLSLGQDTY